MATIQEVYIALFGRPADPVGYKFYVEATDDGANLDAVGSLANSPEYLERFEGQSEIDMINQIYMDLFGRPADAEGLLYYVELLQSGESSLQDIAIRILDGASGTDEAIIENKVAAAQAFTDALDTGTEISAYQGDAAADAGRAFLQGVTGDDATVPTAEEVDAAVLAIEEEAGETPISSTFTLTAGDDFADVAGSSRNDGTIESDFVFTSNNEAVSATSATLGFGDVLADSSTGDSDQLNVAVQGNAGAIAGANVTNIEDINVSLTNGNGILSLANAKGVQNLTLTGAVTAAGIAINAIGSSGVSAIDTSAVTVAAGGDVELNAAAADQNITYTGGAAVDFITLGEGDNVVTTGAGADDVLVADGNNTIDVGAGADIVSVGDGDNTITLGNGANELDGGDGDNVVTSLEASDDIDLGNGDNTITSGAGNDIIVVGNGDNIITAGAGSDAITLGDGENNIVFGDTDSGLTTATADVIVGFDLNDDNTLDLTVAGTATNYVELGGVAATVEAAVTQATAAGSFSGNSYVLVSGAADSFLLVDTDLDGDADYGIELTGVTAAEFGFADII